MSDPPRVRHMNPYIGVVDLEPGVNVGIHRVFGL